MLGHDAILLLTLLVQYRKYEVINCVAVHLRAFLLTVKILSIKFVNKTCNCYSLFFLMSYVIENILRVMSEF